MDKCTNVTIRVLSDNQIHSCPISLLLQYQPTPVSVKTAPIRDRDKNVDPCRPAPTILRSGPKSIRSNAIESDLPFGE